MNGIRPGVCMLWKPASNGPSAVVTVVALDLDKDKALVHVVKASTGACAPHWVDLASLTEAPQGTQPCPCAGGSAKDHDAA
ncbi:MAG TPA: hypothetical protein VN436_15190 [Holophaga sp.]|nr:hypothetical protein [Holophaga sp.]